MKLHSFHGSECVICKKGIKTNNRSKRNICYKCNNKAPPKEYRCKGTNAKGEQCGQWAKVDKLHCAHHIPKGE